MDSTVSERVNIALGSGEATPVARTLLRGLAMLETVAGSPGGIGVTEAAAATGIDKGTASRLLGALRDIGYAHQRAQDRKYVLGSRCLWLARAYQGAHGGLTDCARPFLSELMAVTNETVHLAIREGLYMVFVYQDEPNRSVRAHTAIGAPLLMHTTAMGRAIMARMGDRERESLLDEILEFSRSEGSEIDIDRLRADVREAQRKGWAGVDQHDDVMRVAAAITERDGEPIAAITVSGPSYRVDAVVDEIAKQCTESARAVSAALYG